MLGALPGSTPANSDLRRESRGKRDSTEGGTEAGGGRSEERKENRCWISNKTKIPACIKRDGELLATVLFANRRVSSAL